jgi:hypothetical protein
MSIWKHMNCGDQCCDTDEKMYSNILKDLEDMGMLPPVTTTYVDQPLGNTLCSEECVWDTEDETSNTSS